MKSAKHKIGRVCRIVVAVALAATTLSCMGCSSGSNETSGANFDVQDIEIASSGYTIGENNTLRYAFVAKNPNEGHLAHNVVFSVEAYDTTGRMVVGAGNTMQLMYPGQDVGGCGTAEIVASANASQSGQTPDISYIKVTPIMDSIEWSDTSYSSSKLEESISIDNARTASKSADGTLGIRADVSTTLDTVSLEAVTILFDADKNPICGSDVVTFDCTSNASSSVDLTVENAPDYDECYIYISPQTVL